MPAVHLSTIISRSSSAILSHISHLARSFRNYPLLFTLSHNSTTPVDDLSSIVEQLTAFSTQSIGCLSAPLPGSHSRFTACSLAIFDPLNVAAVFRSTIPGTQRVQVGRWRPVGQRTERGEAQQFGGWQKGDVKDWGDVWNANVHTQRLPDELEGIKSEDVSSIIYLTDLAPEGLSSSLLSNFANSPQVGLVALPTPFITGRPFTLFRNNNIYDSGAVGIALKTSAKSSVRDFASRASFVGLSPLSKQMSVTRCEGNMVISLDDQNPAQLLLSCIRESGLSSDLKDAGFVLGVFENGELGQVYSITAGNPSRGTISLSTQRSPKQGATVQFFHRATDFQHDPLTEQGVLFAPYSPTGEPLFMPKSLNFLSVPREDMFMTEANHSEASSEEAYILHDTFMAGSENGFLFSPKRREQPPSSWACTVPGAFATLECVN